MPDATNAPLPAFQGNVIKRGDAEYDDHRYQYGSSSYDMDGIVQPAVIIYATDDADVIMAINYAKEKNIAVAIRTGGHQYSCASSTFGDNIQLDLSNTYTDFTWDNDDCTLATFGISFSLSAFNAKLGEKQRFVPHGQCSHVHLGGHVQTGGYGQLGRSFGLLADQVQKFRIITADGQNRWVLRDVLADKDLFFAVLGGSPGNFGVLTHVTLKVYSDITHANSRGLRATYLYSRDRLKRLLDVMVEMVDDNDFPGDYDYCITMLSAASLALPSFTPDLDERMEVLHPELFGKDGLTFWPPMIVVYAQWANLGGEGQAYDPTFFQKIKDAAGNDDVPFMGIHVNDDRPTPMSKLTADWIFGNVREFNLPYVKRAYLSNSKALKQDHWTDWVCDQINSIQMDAFNDCKLAIQIQHFGGSKSQTYLHGLDGTTAYSWRDSNICCVLDCFHYPDEAARNTAEQWQVENDKGVGVPGAIFSVQDRRVLWGSHDLDLDAVHEHYYDNNPQKYKRLCDIKDKYDPEGIFTPNAFCVKDPNAKSLIPRKVVGIPAAMPAVSSNIPAILNQTQVRGPAVADDRKMAPKLSSFRAVQEQRLMKGGRRGGGGGGVSLSGK